MLTVMLTPHYPKGTKGVSIATTTDREVLQHFKRVMLEEWQRRIEASTDEGEATLYRLEYQRLKNALGIFIPDEASSNDERSQSPSSS